MSTNNSLPAKQSLTARNIHEHIDARAMRAPTYSELPAWVFEILVDRGVNDTNLARAMGIKSTKTINKWKKLVKNAAFWRKKGY